MKRVVIVAYDMEMDDVLTDGSFGFVIGGVRGWWPGANEWLLPPDTGKILDEHLATLKGQANHEFSLPAGKMKLATVHRGRETLNPWWTGSYGDSPLLAAAREFFAANYAFDDDEAVERSQGRLVRLEIDEARGADGCVVQLRVIDGDKYGFSAEEWAHVHAFDTPRENDSKFRRRCFEFRSAVAAATGRIDIEKNKLRKWGRLL
jgi:hypothetical protein